MTDQNGPTVIAQVTVSASADVVKAATVATQHEAGDHSNCGHPEGD